METKNIKVLLAEPHRFVRQALAHLLASQGNFNVTDQVSDGETLLHLISDKTPHIVLLSQDMPAVNGEEVLSILKNKYPRIKVILLGPTTEQSAVDQLLQKGARAFLSKDCAPEDLFETIVSVYQEAP